MTPLPRRGRVTSRGALLVPLLLALPAFAGGARGGAAAVPAPADRGPAAVPEPATVAAVRALAARGTSGTRAFEWLRRLTDEVGPRMSGSPGDRAAVAWAVDVTKSLGFSAVRAEPVTVPAWQRGAEWGEVVSPFPQRLVLAALGGSVATPETGLEAEVVEASSLEALEAMAKASPGAVKGKIVFLSRRMAKDSERNGYGAVVSIRIAGAVRAAKAGAAGVLIRSVGTDSNRLPHTGVMRYEEGVPKIPTAALAEPDAALLSRLLARGAPVVVRFGLSCRTLPDAASANVVAEVPGREAPGEILVLGAHLDSWDLGTGAIDDGAGVAIALEAARLVAEMPRKPRRTLRVVLFADEENRLSGGNAYAKEHAPELPRHVAAFEAGRKPGAGSVSPGGGGADISPMRVAGVPMLSLKQESRDYFDVHHTANDTLDKVDPKALDRAAAAMAAMAYAVADLPSALPRVLPKEPKGP